MGIESYPEAIRGLPFCTWRYEEREGNLTKVPYNPRNGHGARINVPRDFTTMEKALAKAPEYDGVGVRLANGVGCIDVDGCIREDGSLSELARTVLGLFPNAFVETSPSGRGLHLFFFMPEGFSFDKGRFYVNNQEIGMENYFPGYTKRFMTVTGNIYRPGTMEVTAEALQFFEETFMRRPAPRRPRTKAGEEKEKAEAGAEPEASSVLVDEEVIHKAARGSEKFMDLYLGKWEKAGFPSHSEADLSFCTTLAFYCRGDMSQMDRIFRESGLMREKWDQQRGGLTYGETTLQKAVDGCESFYEPGFYQKAAAEEDFAEGEPAASEGEKIDSLLGQEGAWDVDFVLSEEFLSLAAWAFLNDTARFVKLKGRIPKSVGVRTFEKEVKKRTTTNTGRKANVLRLKGISTRGMVVSENWIVDDTGIRHMEEVYGEMQPVLVSSEPVVVTGKLVNVDDGTERLEVAFRRNGSYKKLNAPRADLFNSRVIIKYADEGFPVSSGTVNKMTAYLAEMEAINDKVIPIRRSIRRAGWIGDEFFPYSMEDAIVVDGGETDRILAALKTRGEEKIWLAAAERVRALPFARAVLAASFASPLLSRLQHRNIYLHVWCDSRGGKTAVLKFAVSVWGDPRVLVSKYFSTLVGMERTAGTLRHLPLALDELQTLNQKWLSPSDVVYTLGNGVGKTRGSAAGGVQAVEEWQSCILSTGEQPMSSDSSMDGVNTRLVEINAVPVPDEALAQELHRISEANFGHAGGKYVRWLVKNLGRVREDFDRLRKDFERVGVHADNVAALGLADFYASMAVFGIPEDRAFAEAVEMCRAVLKNLEDNAPKNTTDAAWDFVSGWVASNRAHFSGGGGLSPVFGKIEDGRVYVIAKELNSALEEAGYSYRKSIKGFMERGLIIPSEEGGKLRSQMGRRIKGVLVKVYALKLRVEGAAEDDFGAPILSGD